VYSIDLAIKHPDQPGKFILGIECDGAAYHSSKTARDRDRTRQMVLENLGWTIHRIWSQAWASIREAQIQAISDRVDSLLDGNATSTSTTDVPTHEPDPVPSKSKLDHEVLTEFVEPSLEWNDRYSADKRGQNTANRNSIHDTVTQNGPIKYDTAIQTYLDVWAQSRAGKKVQRAFKSGVQALKKQNKIYQHEDFLWPERHNLDFKVRVNTESATRSIDEVPKEEIAKAIAVLLEEGGRMTRDDVILETTRLIGYQRRGKRIEQRVGDAIDILDNSGVIKFDEDEKITFQSDVNIDEKLLNRIY